eukprot:935408-Rhodomonas_salina.1
MTATPSPAAFLARHNPQFSGDAWEAKAEVFQLEAEQRRLDAARTKLDNQWRAVKERLALS